MSMSSFALRKSAPQFHSSPAGKPRLLIVSDSTERMRSLSASLAMVEVEITVATTLEELNCACRGSHDLAVVDVGPERLPEALKVLRNCAGCANVPLLVEADRLLDGPRLAGVLPTYRAMPCSHTDLITLARRSIAPLDEDWRTRWLL